MYIIFLASCCMFCVSTFSFSQFGVPFVSTSRHPIFVIFVTKGHTCMWVEETIQKLTCIHPLCTCLNRCKICSEGCETSPNDFYIFFLKRHLIPAAVVLSSVLKRFLKIMEVSRMHAQWKPQMAPCRGFSRGINKPTT